MKKIIAILTAFFLIVLFMFSAMAEYIYEGMYITVKIPDSFERYEFDDEPDYVTFLDSSNDNQINISEKYNSDKIDWGNLSADEIEILKEKADSLFITEGEGCYFTLEPRVSKVEHPYNGIKVYAEYIDPGVSEKTISCSYYLFSTEHYAYTISFMSFNSYTSWYEEVLDSLMIGWGYAGSDSRITETTVSSTDSSGFDFGNIGKICLVVIVAITVINFITGRKQKK